MCHCHSQTNWASFINIWGKLLKLGADFIINIYRGNFLIFGASFINIRGKCLIGASLLIFGATFISDMKNVTSSRRDKKHRHAGHRAPFEFVRPLVFKGTVTV